MQSLEVTIRGWRPRFRLRTLLIGLTLLSIPLSLLGIAGERARRRARTLDAIAQLGGQAWSGSRRATARAGSAWEWIATLGGQERFQPIRAASISGEIDAAKAPLLVWLESLEVLELDRCRLSPEAQQGFSRWTNLTSLNVVAGSFSDHDLNSFVHCQKLRSLHLQGTQVTPQGLELLSRYSQLTELEFGLAAFTKEHLAALRHAPRLESLDLSHGVHGTLDDQTVLALPALPRLETLTLKWNRSLRGTGLACVERLPELRWLNIDGCPLQDEALGHLEKAPKLGQLILDASRVSQAAVERLTDAHPEMGFVDTSGTY